MHEALFWKKEGKAVKCELCPFGCIIPEGKIGNCGVRKNRGGKLYSLVYGKVAAYHVDPIEKKPLYHFAPATQTFSIATVGCNFHCLHCQNWELSQSRRIMGIEMSPEEVVERCKSVGAQGISYTYTEPTVFFEFALDTMKIARMEGLYNVFVTNGFINEAPLKLAAKYLDAANVDVKAFRDEFYREICKAPTFEPVKRTVELLNRLGVHVEVTYLIIPNRNDNMDEISEMCEWLVSVDDDIPLHFSRYHPDYMLDEPPTPLETLLRAREIAMEKGVKYVYLGNVMVREALNTYCPNCHHLLIERDYMQTLRLDLSGDTDKPTCPNCGSEVRVHGLKYTRAVMG